MTRLSRGRVYRASLDGVTGDKFFVVVSNNRRNRNLDSVLAVRFTSSRKPNLPSIVPVPASEIIPGGHVVCDDIYELFEDEVKADIGAVAPPTMQAIERGLKAALDLP